MTTFFAAAYALILREGTFLVTKRAAGTRYMPSKWDIPGGTIEAGESPEEALIREIHEETRISVEIEPIIFVYNNMVQFPKRQTFQMIFLAKYKEGEVQLNFREHSEFRWIYPEEMKKMDCINFLSAMINSEHVRINDIHKTE